MRLLNISTRKLEDFLAKPPPYAILSHAWEQEEVQFSDLKDSAINHTSMAGWDKINGACNQALANKLKYLWVDTICIDKSSSSELSEAINSMFKWYRESAVCYVYLYDHGGPGIRFRDSKWFTRGWTLQEMIAPAELTFYDKAWNSLGTKDSLISQLHEITRVDVTILKGGDLRLISVARKMSWAAERQTSRVEDIAYCLLGLFDISMPMLYGEGDKAFRRLQEEIIKEYDDHSLFAWRDNTGSGAPTGLFAKSPADFISSAGIVPCGNSGTEPTIVTSRGLRLRVRIRSSDESQDAKDNGAGVLALLNCREVKFGVQSGDRIALELGKCYSFTEPSSRDNIRRYIRLNSKDLFTLNTARNTVSKSIYVLKEDYLHGMAGPSTIWVRTLPVWPEELPFELALAHPRECWDEKNNRFLVDMKALRSSGDVKFALVFRQTTTSEGSPTASFVVFLGLSVKRSEESNNWRFLPWCSLSFHHTWRPDAQNLDLITSYKDSLNKTSWGQLSDREIGLQCYFSTAIMAGQTMYCVDLNASDGPAQI